MKAPIIVLGPPGTGKTTTLLNMVQEEVAAGIDPTEIAFISFTKRAAHEGIERCGLDRDQIPWFRTIHSFCFRALGLDPARVFDHRDQRNLKEITGLDFTNAKLKSGDWMNQPLGSQGLFLDGLARNLGVALPIAYQRLRGVRAANLQQLAYVRACLEKYKAAHDVIDFTGMLEIFLAEGSTPHLRTLFVDEAQDLTPLQWRVVWAIAKRSGLSKMVVAGDDDQAIFNWAGAMVPSFARLRGEEIFLEQSYRCGVGIYQKAKQTIPWMGYRREKQWHPRQERGRVELRRSWESLDWATGTWLVLSRNVVFLQDVKRFFDREGWFYEFREDPSTPPKMARAIRYWEKYRESGDPEDLKRALPYIRRDTHPDRKRPWYEALTKIGDRKREYIRAGRRKGEKFLERPRIRLSTIHSAKGGEADNVVLLTDVTKRSVASDTSGDAARLMYVAMTRARDNLFIIRPRKTYHFDRVLYE